MISGVLSGAAFLLRGDSGSIDVSYLENAAIIQHNRPRRACKKNFEFQKKFPPDVHIC